jgi:membrane protein DedA with SNARE-associated domain
MLYLTQNAMYQSTIIIIAALTAFFLFSLAWQWWQWRKRQNKRPWLGEW